MVYGRTCDEGLRKSTKQRVIYIHFTIPEQRFLMYAPQKHFRVFVVLVREGEGLRRLCVFDAYIIFHSARYGISTGVVAPMGHAHGRGGLFSNSAVT